MKKKIAFVLVFIMVFGVLPFSELSKSISFLINAKAETIVDSGICGAHLTWTLDSDGLLTISGTGKMTNYFEDFMCSTAPWSGSKSNCDRLKSVIIQSGVTSIGDSAFSCCTRLTSITIPDSVTSIGDSAFEGCTGLTSITIPDSVTSIGNRAFYGCTRLTSITIPDSVTSIGSYAFCNCTGLTSITISDSVTSIGYEAFHGCTGLTSVTIPNSVTSIGDFAFSYCTGLTSVTIPNSVTSIGDLAFSGCTGLTSVTIPDSVTSIGTSAFRGCTGLTTVTIGNSVTSIGYFAFGECTGMTDVYCSLQIWDLIKEDVPATTVFHCSHIGSGTCGDNLNWYLDNEGSLTVTGTGSMTSAPWKNYNTYIKTITLPDGLTSIYTSAFYGCTNIKSIKIPNNVKSIGQNAFSGCTALTDVYFSGSLQQWDSFRTGAPSTTVVHYSHIGSGACGDNLNWYLDNDGNLTVTGTGEMTSAPWKNYNKYVKEITLPDGLTSIYSSAFYGCANIQNITIPNSVISIGQNAFSGCTALTDVYFSGSLQQWDSFRTGAPSTTVIHYSHIGSGTCGDNLNWYLDNDGNLTVTGTGEMTSAPWKNYNKYVKEITFPDGLTSIYPSAFYGCANIKNITIPNSVKSIGQNAFSGCAALTDVYFSGSLQQWDSFRTGAPSTTVVHYSHIGSGTCGDNLNWYLDNDGNLTVTGTGEMTSAPWINYIKYVKTITLPDGLTSIYSSAFNRCENITNVIIPNSVTTIGDSAFSGCFGLTNITIPDSVTTLGSSAFSDCTGLEALILGGGAESIPTSAFSGCTSLKTVTIPNTVYNIYDDAFKGCTAITDIYYLGTQEDWNQIYFGRENQHLKKATLHFHEHTWNNGEITKPATVTEEGVKTFTCTVCGNTKTESIPKLTGEQTIDTDNAKESGNTVYTAPGLTANELLTAAGNGTVLKDRDGKTVPSDKALCSGMVLTKADGTTKVIVIKGDNNGDGEITSADARYALRVAVSLDTPNEWQENACLVSGGKEISSADARLILRAAVGLQTLDLI